MIIETDIVKLILCEHLVIMQLSRVDPEDVPVVKSDRNCMSIEQQFHAIEVEFYIVDNACKAILDSREVCFCFIVDVIRDKELIIVIQFSKFVLHRSSESSGD
jgi:hypothetical protein